MSGKNCNQVGFDSTWDHVRSILNPDRLFDDCDVVIHDGLDCTSAHAESLLKPERLMVDCVDDPHDGRFGRSNHPTFLLKPERAQGFAPPSPKME